MAIIEKEGKYIDQIIGKSQIVFDINKFDLTTFDKIVSNPQAFLNCYQWHMEWLAPEEVISLFKEIDSDFRGYIYRIGYENLRTAMFNDNRKIKEYVASGHKLPALVVKLEKDGSYHNFVEGIHRTYYAMENNLYVPVYFFRILYKNVWGGQALYSCEQ